MTSIEGNHEVPNFAVLHAVDKNKLRIRLPEKLDKGTYVAFPSENRANKQDAPERNAQTARTFINISSHEHCGFL